MPLSSIWKRDCFFWACDENLWNIMPISSIWERNCRVFSGLVMGTSFENGISVSFWAFLENNANIFYLKTGFISLFLGLWWEPLENNANIFYLKTDVPCFFWACDGNLIWKRDNANIFNLKTGFPFFLGLWWERLENNTNIFFLRTGFPLFFFGLWWNLWKIMPISSIWKRNFRGFFGLVMGTSGK